MPLASVGWLTKPDGLPGGVREGGGMEARLPARDTSFEEAVADRGDAWDIDCGRPEPAGGAGVTPK